MSADQQPHEKTITREDAAELFELLEYDHNAVGDDGPAVGPWTLVGSSVTDQGRWHERYYLVVRDETGDTYGLRYGIGLTEYQENDLPWDDARGPLPLTRLHAHTVTRVEYRPEPA